MKNEKTVYKKKEFDFSKYDCFFAFGNSQLKKGLERFGRKEEEYIGLSGGLCCPKEHAKTIWKKFSDFALKELKRELKIRGRYNMIRYQLANYESWYTGDISDAFCMLKPLGITEKEVLDVYRKESENQL